MILIVVLEWNVVVCILQRREWGRAVFCHVAAAVACHCRLHGGAVTVLVILLEGKDSIDV